MNRIEREKLTSCIVYCFGLVCFGGIIGTLGPSIPYYARSMNLPIEDLGKFFSCRGLGFIVGVLLNGRFIKNAAFGMGCLVMGAASIICAVSNNFYILCAAFFL